jgi:hypothetical protein
MSSICPKRHDLPDKLKLELQQIAGFMGGGYSYDRTLPLYAAAQQRGPTMRVGN